MPNVQVPAAVTRLPPEVGVRSEPSGETVAAGACAEHCAVAPPFDPAQLQLHGPVPVTADAVPALHRLPPDGAVFVVAPFAAPHTPLTGAGVSFAEHCAAVPPFDPAQVQSHGPLPLTLDAVPVLHRLVVGAALTAFRSPRRRRH